MKQSAVSYQDSIDRNLQDFTFEVGTMYEDHSRRAVDYFLSHIPNPEFVVDLGCGDGAAIRQFRKRDVSTVGIDINRDKLALVPGKKEERDFLTYLIGLSSGSIPCFFSHHALEHVPNPREILREMGRTLEPKGYCFIAVPYKDILHDVHFSAFSRKNELVPDGMRMLESTIDSQSGAYWVISQK